LIEKLSYGYETLIQNCILVLGNIAYKNRKKGDYMLRLGLMGKLEFVLEKAEQELTREYVFWALKNLTKCHRKRPILNEHLVKIARLCMLEI
jgi:hypothetical protein